MNDTGIQSFGAYLPRLRLERAAIVDAIGWAAGLRAGKPQGARSYCAWDEDALTMAVEAARDCLSGHDRSGVASLVFASTTHPFADRCNAGVVAEALDLPQSLRTTDGAGHQRAGVSALLERCAMRARMGNGRWSLRRIVALPRPAANRNRVSATAPRQRSSAPGPPSRPSTSPRRRCARTLSIIFEALKPNTTMRYEERWIRDEGYLALMPRAIKAALGSIDARDVKHLLVQGPQRFAAAVAQGAGIRAEAVTADLHAECGDTGVAHPLLLLGSALEKAQAGDLIVLAGFGQGCDVVVLQATGRAPSAGPRGQRFARGRGVESRLCSIPCQLRPRRHGLGHARRTRQPHGTTRGLATSP